MAKSERRVCIAGAGGLVGSNLVKQCLENGDHVIGTLRDSSAENKISALMQLPGAESRLHLVSADMGNAGDFDEILAGVDCVFIACLVPTYVGVSGKKATDMDDQQGYEEIVRPTLDGCLNILKSADKNNVSTVVICSSTSSTNPPNHQGVKSEADWSDENTQYQQKKYTSAAKTVMEKAAIEFAEERGMRLCIFLPTLMIGPAVIPEQANSGFMGLLKVLMSGKPGPHKKVPNDSMSMIHVGDLAAMMVAASNNGSASGRYFGVYDSWSWQDIYAEIGKNIPDACLPEPLQSPPAQATQFDFSRRDSLGVPIRDIPTLLKESIEWIRRH